MKMTLPIGLRKSDGTMIKEVEVRELDGYSRKIITDVKGMRNPAKIATGLIGRNITLDGKSIGDSLAQQMFVVDRNAALIGIQRESYGDVVSSHYVCPWCNKGFETEDNLAELECVILPVGEYIETVTVALEKGYTDKTGDEHHTVIMRLPTGLDEEITSHALSQNYGEWCAAMIVRVTKEFGTLDMNKFAGLGVKVVDELTARDIDKLINAISMDLPGYRTSRVVMCTECGRESKQRQDMSRFFMPGHILNMR